MDRFLNFSNPFLEYERIIYHLNAGDLIEIDRGNYTHWAIFEKIDENSIVWCFHATRVPRKKITQIPDFNTMACIRYETLHDILGDNQEIVLSKCRINNQEKAAQKLIEKEGIKRPDLKVVFEELHNIKDNIIEYDPKVSMI